MPEISVSVGGRHFRIGCKDGEEHLVQAAAKILDEEAAAVLAGTGQPLDTRMLLMAGLMVADKAVGMEEQLVEMRQRAEAAEEKLVRKSNASASGPDSAEIPAIPQEVTDGLAAVAARAEELAASVEKKSAD